MKRFSRLCAVVLVGTALMAGAAHAADSVVHFGVGGGLALPVGDLKDLNYNAGFNGNVRVGIKPAGKNFGLLVQGDYNQLGGDDLGITTNRKAKIMDATLDAVFMPPVEGKLHPYFGAGFGVYSVKTSQVTGTISSDNSDSMLGFNGLIGFSMKAGEKMGWGLSAQYHTASKNNFNSTWIPITLNVMFN